MVTGSTGMLGKDIMDILSGAKEHEIFGVSRRAADIKGNSIKQYVVEMTDLDSLSRTTEEIDPQVIIHCAANTDVDDCERNRKYAHDLHVEATKILADYNSAVTRFFYISSDSVFDGKKGDYSPGDMTNPLNYYARTKLEGELAAVEGNPNSVIIRTNIYGFHVPLKRSLVEWALQNWEQGKMINGYEDVCFNPLYTKQLARIILRLMKEKGIKGIINAGIEEKITKYDFLLMLAESLGYKRDLVNKTSIEDVNYLASRPKNTTLNINMLKKIIGHIEGLKEGINELKLDLIDGKKAS